MSQLVNCKACGKEIAKGVKKCVHCGKDQRNFFMKHKIISGILVLALLGAIGSALGNDEPKKVAGNDKATSTSSNNETKKDEPKKEEPKKEDAKVTYENFMKVSMGAKYDDVKTLLGEGKEMSSSEVAGIKTAIYTWNGSGISNMNVTIQNGEVIGKAQMGLQKFDGQMTLEKFNQIKEGMSYDEIKAIAGDGQLTSQTKVMGMESIIYTWVNKDGANMTGTFTGGKLDMKAQFNLK